MADQYEAMISNGHNDINTNPSRLVPDENFDDFDEDFLDLYTMTPLQRAMYHCKRLARKLLGVWQSLPMWKKFLLVFAGVVNLVFVILMLVYHNRIMQAVAQASDEIKQKKYFPLVFIALLYLVSFPPLIGFSSLATCVGLTYGISAKGFVTLFIGTASGSISAFVVFKTLLKSQAEKLVRMNSKFEALTSILQDDDSYLTITLIRLCPFPYSYTNGAIAGIYGVSVLNFSKATVLMSPKLFLYLFVGSRLKNMGESRSTGSRIFDVISLVVTAIVQILTAWIVYRKATKRQRELRQAQDADMSFDVL
ncbi:LAMI_0H10198g1_1 [Lachancea mirantina]|uniref:Golgi apparatus membrane protein TVP38 n=1 Tax=Lachancea mirantina TaxID=1230905 RepID=A0A1G4KH43_9SACH|nr:LAMI_0H10198g1_1 [Lachancea mirantina]